MESVGTKPRVLRAGAANLFLSPVFCESLASAAGVRIELYNTDGAQGAARAAAVGAGLVPSVHDAFRGLDLIRLVEPESNRSAYLEAYDLWLECLKRVMSWRKGEQAFG
jgi:xylulokinase